MAPRAIVQQAIELLNIHQMRRENAAIYKQVTSLRSEVAEFRDFETDTRKQLDQTEAELQKSNEKAAQISADLNKINNRLSRFVKDEDDIRKSLTSHIEQQNKQYKNVENQYGGFNERVIKLEAGNEEMIKRRETLQKSIDEEVHKLRVLLLTKVEDGQLEAIKFQLKTLEGAVGMIQNQQHSLGSTSRVYDSIEQVTEQDQCIRDRPSYAPPEQINTTKSLNSDLLAYQPEDRVREQTLLTDLDLDTETASLISIEEPTQAICKDSFIMLPYQTKKDTQVDEILALKQADGECLTSYLKRGEMLIQQLPQTSENVVVKQLVRGLADQGHQDAFTKWLDRTSWCNTDLLDVACLVGVNIADLNPGDHATQHNGQGDSGDLTPHVLVPATESLKHVSDVPKYAAANRNPPKARPQKLNQISARVAGPIPKANSAKRKLIFNEANVKAKHKVSNEILANNTPSDRSPRNPYFTYNLEAAKPQHVDLDEASTSIPSPPPHTPRKQPPHFHQLLTNSTTSYSGPSTPLKNRKPKPPNPVRKLDFNPRPTITLLSPYNPCPQLISGDQAQMSGRGWETSSDADVFLPQNKRLKTLEVNKGVARYWSAREQGRDAEREKTRRRVPLPPPPLIPIMSTTDDEFCRW